MRPQVLLVATVLATYAKFAIASENGNEVLGLTDLQKVANQVRNFKPKDEFDAPPIASNLTGQSFSVTVKPKKRGPSNFICDGFPSWGYFAQQSNLEVSFNDGSILTSGLTSDSFTAAFPQDKSLSGSFLRFASFTCDHSKQGQYAATNAFGAAANVAKETDAVVAFSDQDSPSRMPTDAVTYWSHTVSGDAARTLSGSVAIRITGVIGVWANGHNVICGTKHSSPTLDFPYDQTLNACIFKSTSLQFEVLDEKKGEVLHRTSSTRGGAD
jgi:hypothetical protein